MLGIHMYKILFILLICCGSSLVQAKDWMPPPISKRHSVHDTCHTAVPIQASNETQGLNQERKWTFEHYPNWQWQAEANYNCAKFKADRITLKHISGNEIVVLFNTSSFYGKW